MSVTAVLHELFWYRAIDIDSGTLANNQNLEQM